MTELVTPPLPAPEATAVTPGSGQPLVTIVLPCYNEGEHVLLEIERITTAMLTSGLSYELLCIDDASTDNTLEVLKGAQQQYPNIRLLPFRRNGGSGTARSSAPEPPRKAPTSGPGCPQSG